MLSSLSSPNGATGRQQRCAAGYRHSHDWFGNYRYPGLKVIDLKTKIHGMTMIYFDNWVLDEEHAGQGKYRKLCHQRVQWTLRWLMATVQRCYAEDPSATPFSVVEVLGEKQCGRFQLVRKILVASSRIITSLSRGRSGSLLYPRRSRDNTVATDGVKWWLTTALRSKRSSGITKQPASIAKSICHAQCCVSRDRRQIWRCVERRYCWSR